MRQSEWLTWNFGDVVAEVENYLTSGMTFDKIAACHAKQD